MITSPLPYCSSARRLTEEVACVIGEGVRTPLNPKELTRCVIRGAAGELSLSVPVEGGNRILRPLYRDGLTVSPMSLDDVRLSEHGNWRHLHVSALRTAYSATPFFLHYSPEIISAIEESESLGELLRGVMSPFDEIFSEDNISQLTTLSATSPERTLQLCNERRKELAWHLSSLDILFRKGPETIFALWPTLHIQNSLTCKRD